MRLREAEHRNHLAMELFKLHFKVDLTHVPYKGTAGAVTDLLGGEVQVMFLPVHVALSHVQAGSSACLPPAAPIDRP
jgi:tripartite-type tricarboxylate transporter receptor subunit TctC